MEIYEELLDRLEASNLDARHDLRDAVALSATYVSLAGLYRRDSIPEKARALYARHVALWREWESRLPKNSLAQRQLRVARGW